MKLCGRSSALGCRHLRPKGRRRGRLSSFSQAIRPPAPLARELITFAPCYTVCMSNIERLGDARQFSPSAARNCSPIRDVLTRVLPKKGVVLEVGSGTGEHVVCFAKALTRLVWLPSDPDGDFRTSIEAWTSSEGLTNVRAPVSIDVREDVWGVEQNAPFDAMISLNMVHIAPWEAALGLLAGGERLLRLRRRPLSVWTVHDWWEAYGDN